MSRFTVFYNGECIKTYDLEEPVIFIGRLPENNISIANMGISRRHAKIEEDADRKYLISDLNSLNGTYVNGKRIKKVELCHADKITIGKYTILYEEISVQNDAGIDNSMAMAQMAPVMQAPLENQIDLQNSYEGQIDDYDDALPEQPMMQNPNVAETGINRLPEEGIPEESDDKGFSKSVTSESVLIETNKHVVYKLDKAFLTMGNGDNDDIFISGFMIGEGQISVEKREEGFYICANKLMGKFKVNGKATKTHYLRHKDRIEIGSSTFRYMENG